MSDLVPVRVTVFQASPQLRELTGKRGEAAKAIAEQLSTLADAIQNLEALPEEEQGEE